jgi:rubrerythrin
MASTNIQSTSELISIALAAERAAVRRYTGLTEKMRAHGNQEAADVYAKLVKKEKKHEKKITEWAALEGMVVDDEAVSVRWEDPSVMTDYDVQARDPYRCTAYKALAFAVHNEERAFLFYTYVAADSDSEEVSHHARVLAGAELDHAASIRAMRRKAWHEQSESINASRIDPSVINSTAELLAVIVFIERYILQLFRLANKASELDKLVEDTRKALTDSQNLLRLAATPGSRVTTTLQRVAPWAAQMLEEARVDTNAALRRLNTDSDRSFTFYNSVVESTDNEDVMLMAQEQSALALQRNAALRQLNYPGSNQTS